MFFFFNDTATTEIYTLSLHDALPISGRPGERPVVARRHARSAHPVLAGQRALPAQCRRGPLGGREPRARSAPAAGPLRLSDERPGCPHPRPPPAPPPPRHPPPPPRPRPPPR